MAEEGEEEIIGDETEILKFKKLEDDGSSKILITYFNQVEVDETKFEQECEVEVSLLNSRDGQLILRFERNAGDLLYFKKIVNDIRSRCFAL